MVQKELSYPQRQYGPTGLQPGMRPVCVPLHIRPHTLQLAIGGGAPQDSRSKDAEHGCRQRVSTGMQGYSQRQDCIVKSALGVIVVQPATGKTRKMGNGHGIRSKGVEENAYLRCQ